MKEKLTVWQRHARIQKVLEKHRRFDYDYIPFGDYNEMPDANYEYRPNFFSRIAGMGFRLFTFTFGWLLLQLAYGVRVRGRENLKPLKGKGCFYISNHFSNLDVLFDRHAIGHFRPYITVAPWNNKKGLFGWVLRRGGILPFSANLAATRNLYAEVDRLLKKGKWVGFYPEQAMWVGYQKPRPMKEGAFRFAVRYNAPVLPLFCTFDLTKKHWIRNAVMHIMPAIYPDESLPKGERAEDMRRRAEAAWKTCYEEYYKIPLKYEDLEEESATERKQA